MRHQFEYSKWARKVTATSLVFTMLLSGLVLFVPGVTMEAEGWVTPGTGGPFTMDDLVFLSGGAVTGAGGVYQVNDIIQIANPDMVMIQPGEWVEFTAPPTGFLVDGMLDIQLATLTSSTMTPGDWDGVSVSAAGFLNMWDSTIEYANIGVQVFAPGIMIMGGTVRDCMTEGVYIGLGGSATIDGCILDNNMANGIYIDGGSADISSCIIQNSGLNGVHIYQGMAPIDIWNNCNINNNANNGIYLEESDVTISGNDIWGNMNGIYNFNNLGNSLIEFNDIHDNLEKGIWYDSSMAAGDVRDDVRYNEVFQNGFPFSFPENGGVCVSNWASPEVYENNITNNPGYGVYCFMGQDLWLHDNNISDNAPAYPQGAGAYYSGFGGGGGGQVSSNLISNNPNGFWADQDGPWMFDYNTVTNNDNIGVYYNFIMGGPMLTGNNITYNDQGFVCIDSTAMADNNNITNNNIGVNLNGSLGAGAWIFGNNISDNTETGVWFNSTPTCSVTGNDILNNGIYGVYANDSCDWSWLDNNQIQGSSYGVYLDNIGQSQFTLQDNNITENGFGLLAVDSDNIDSSNNDYTWGSSTGILFVNSNGTFTNDQIANNSVYGVNTTSGGKEPFFESCLIIDNPLGMTTIDSAPFLSNCTIANAIWNPLLITADSHPICLNTTFDKASVSIGDALSDLWVKWFMHVYVQNADLDPVPTADVTVVDLYDTLVINSQTDAGGYVPWIVVDEYYEDQGGRTYYTEHNATATKLGYKQGWAIPEPNMDMSKIVVITLDFETPDLTVTQSDISFEPSDIVDVDWVVNVKAVITNNGGKAKDVIVRFYDGDPDTDNNQMIDGAAQEIGLPDTITVPTFGTALASTSWSPPVNGTYDIYVWPDAENLIAEVDETNNLDYNTLNAYHWTDDFNNLTRISDSSNIVAGSGDAMLEHRWTVRYDGDVMPGAATPPWGTWGNSALATLMGDGTLEIDDDSDIDRCMFDRSWGLSDSTDFTIEARVKSTYSSWPYNDPAIHFCDGARLEWLEIRPDRIMLHYADIAYFMDATDYHTYRITREDNGASDDLKVYVDGILRIDAPASYNYANGGNEIRFGSATSSYYSTSYWDYVYYSTEGAFPPGTEPYETSGYVVSTQIDLATYEWDKLFIDKTEPDANHYIEVSVLNGTTDEYLAGYTDLTGTEIDISGIDPVQYPTLKLRANFTGDGSNTPILHYWAVNWKTYISFDIPIDHNGWNLISVPLVQTDTDFLTVFSDFTAGVNYNILQWYDASDPNDPWKLWHNNKPSHMNDLTDVDHTMGIWIDVLNNDDGFLTVWGYLAQTTTIPLYTGWNLVGYPTLTTGVTVSQAFAGLGANYKVKGYDGGSPYRLRNLPDADIMVPGQGYWVWVDSDCLWTVNW